MTELEIVELVHREQEWIRWAFGAVIGIQSMVLVGLLALPGRLRKDYFPREVLELRLAANDAFHAELARDVGNLKAKIADATTAINGHAATETEILSKILMVLEDNSRMLTRNELKRKESQ